MDQVEEVKGKTDIVSIISERIELKKAGRNFKAICPFHGEKTPSFNVSPELQIYKCFGCQRGGDCISFLQEYEGMDFYEALKYLADKSGVKLKPLQGERSDKEVLYKLNSLASKFYQFVLLNHEAGKAAFNYLVRQRGLKEDMIRHFSLGYCPDTPFAIRKFLLEKHKYTLETLEKAGIIYKSADRAGDRFRGRVIFPLFDHRDNIVGFAGRIITPRDDIAKYINTPETEIYHKSRVLYGLNFSKGEIKRKGFAIIVEGELDMISCFQAGIKNVVAIKGTALTEEQVRLLSRYTKKVVLALDTDLAGDAAARRGIEIMDRQNFEIKVAALGKYKDPDEMVRGNPSAFKKAIGNSVIVWDFIIASIFSRFSGKEGEGLAEISREVVSVLASIADKIIQAHYIDKVAKKLQVPVEAVSQQVFMSKNRSDSKPATETFALKKEQKSRRQILEERLLVVGLAHDFKVLLNKEVHGLIETRFAKRIIEELIAYNKLLRPKGRGSSGVRRGGKFDPSGFAGKLPAELVDGFSDLILKDIGEIQGSLAKEIELIKKELRVIKIKDELAKKGEEIRSLESSDKTKETQKLQEEFGELTRQLSKLEDENLSGIIH